MTASSNRTEAEPVLLCLWLNRKENDMQYEGEFNGIKYNSYLVSKDGVEIVLYTEKHHTKEDIKQAIVEAKHTRDVVRLRKESI
jgi:flavorubredoxin